MTRPIRNTPPVYILGGAQTDFARNWTREGHDLASLIAETAQGAITHAKVDAREVEVGHVSSFIPELTTRQSHLGGLLVEADRGFTGMPTSRLDSVLLATDRMARPNLVFWNSRYSSTSSTASTARMPMAW